MVDTRFSVSVQIMMTLGYHQEELLNSEKLARILKTNPTFVRRLVSNLVEANLVKSYRGKGGGIELGRAPKEISLKEIYMAATEDKTVITTHQVSSYKVCKVSCCIKSVMSEIVDGVENSIQSYLGKKTLNDLMKQVN